MISVIVCTKDRAQGLISCFDAIEKSLLKAGQNDAELIAVNNNSQDNTSDVIKGWSDQSKIQVKYVLENNVGISAARNAGIRAVSGDLIIFTDDDCCLDEDYVAQALQYFQDDKALTMRSGSVLLGDPEDLPLTIKKNKSVRTWLFEETIQKEGEILGRSLIGCNMALKREAIEKIGFFDETLGAGTRCKAAEDTDYFYRAYLAKVQLQAVPDMVVHHFHGRKTVDDEINLKRNYAIGNGALAFKYLFRYPRFSRHFYWSFRSYIKEKNPEKRIRQRGEVLNQLKGVWAYICTCFNRAATRK